jgi:hypothetical protein
MNGVAAEVADNRRQLLHVGSALAVCRCVVGAVAAAGDSCSLSIQKSQMEPVWAQILMFVANFFRSEW